MKSLSSLVRSSLAKALGFASLVAVALMAMSIGGESAHAGNPVVLNRKAAVALNPQPLPPRYIGVVKLLTRNRAVKPLKYGDTVSLNPQPLPPRWIGAISLGRPGDKVSLNPQPLPPKAILVSPLMLRLK